MNLVTQWGYNPAGIPSQIPSGYCTVPGGLAFSVLNNSVYLSWNAPHEYAAFFLEYRKVGDVAKQSVYVYGSNTRLTLDGGTQYEWWISTVCDLATDRKSTAVQGGNFTTAAALPVRDVVTGNELVLVPKFDSIKAYWTASSGVSYYEIYYRPTAFADAPWLMIISKTNQVDIINLFQDSEYEIHVDSIYGATPAAGESKTTRTLASTLGQVNGMRAYAQSESAFVNWNGVIGANSYNVLLDGLVYRSGFQGTIIDINGLAPSTGYKVEVIANSEVAASLPTAVEFSTIAEAVPAVLNLQAVVNGNNIDVVWDKVDNPDNHIIYINGSAVELLGTAESYTIIDAIPSKEYLIGVCAVKNNVSSETKVFRLTMSFYVAKPGNVFAVAIGKDSLSLAWVGVPGAVVYELERTHVLTSTVVTTTYETPEALQTGLITNNAYSYRVRAKQGVLTSAWTTAFVVSTSNLPISSVLSNLLFTEPRNTSVRVSFNLRSGLTTGDFNISFVSAGNPTLSLNTAVSENNLISGIVPGATYAVTITNNEPDSLPSYLIGEYVAPASIGTITGLALAVSADRSVYTISGTGVAGGNYRFRYRVIGTTGWTALGTYDTLGRAFTLVSGHYEFEVTLIKNGIEADPQIVQSTRFLPYNITVSNFSRRLLIGYDRILTSTGFQLELTGSDNTPILLGLGEKGGVVYDIAPGYYKVRIKNLYDGSFSLAYYVQISDTIAITFTSDNYDCVGCCTEDGQVEQLVKTYAATITGPQTFTIPDGIKGFSITNLGNGSKVYADIAVSGIQGVGSIPAGVRVYAISMDDSNVVITGMITVAPASGHAAFISYIM